jgi:hypothetical protein
VNDFTSRLVPVSQGEETPSFISRLVPANKQPPEESGDGVRKQIAKELQFPLGVAKFYTQPANIASAAQVGASYDALRDLKESDWINLLSNPEHPELDLPYAMDRVNELNAKYFPTQNKAEELVEEATGIPLQPKSDTDRGLRQFAFGSRVAGPVGGAVAASAYFIAKGAGASDEDATAISDLSSVAPSFYRFLTNFVKNTYNPVLKGQILPPLARGQNPKQIPFKPTIEVSPTKTPQVPNQPTPPVVQLPQAIQGGKTNITSIPRPRGQPPSVPAANIEPQPKFSSTYDMGKAVQQRVNKDVRQAALESESPEQIDLSGPLGPRPEALPKANKPLTKIEKRDPTGQNLQHWLMRDVVKPIITKEKPTLEQDVLNQISPDRYDNESIGGRQVNQQVAKIDDLVYDQISPAYQLANDLTKDISGNVPDLNKHFREVINDLSGKTLSGPSAKRLSFAQDMVSRLAKLDNKSRVIGHVPISVPKLIGQSQELNRMIKFDFAHGEATKVFLQDQKAIDAAIEKLTGQDPEAYRAWKNAKATRQYWASIFDNDYINPWRDLENRNYISLYRSAFNPDKFNELKRVLELTPQGEQALARIKVDLLKHHVGDYLEHPEKIFTPKGTQAFRELRSVFTPKEVQNIRTTAKRHMEAARHRPITFRANKPVPVTKVPYTTKTKEKHPLAEMGPEKIGKLARTQEGLDTLEEVLRKNPLDRKLLHNIKEETALDILSKGKIQPHDKSKSIKEALNDKDTLAVLNRLLGPVRVNQLRTIVDQSDKIEVFLNRLAEDRAKAAKEALALNKMHAKGRAAAAKADRKRQLKQEKEALAALADGDKISNASKNLATVFKFVVKPIKSTQSLLLKLFSAKNIEKFFHVSEKMKGLPKGKISEETIRQIAKDLGKDLNDVIDLLQ